MGEYLGKEEILEDIEEKIRCLKERTEKVNRGFGEMEDILDCFDALRNYCYVKLHCHVEGTVLDCYFNDYNDKTCDSCVFGEVPAKDWRFDRRIKLGK